MVTLSFYLRRWMGPRGWRLVHGLSYAACLLALVQGLFSGTAAGSVGVLAFYWITATSALALTVYRIVVSRQPGSAIKNQIPSNGAMIELAMSRLMFACLTCPAG